MLHYLICVWCWFWHKLRVIISERYTSAFKVSGRKADIIKLICLIYHGDDPGWYTINLIKLVVTTQLNLNSSWSDYIMTWTTPPTHHETLCCCCAAGRVTIGDSTSLLTTYRATMNVVTTKISPTLV